MLSVVCHEMKQFHSCVNNIYSYGRLSTTWEYTVCKDKRLLVHWKVEFTPQICFLFQNQAIANYLCWHKRCRRHWCTSRNKNKKNSFGLPCAVELLTITSTNSEFEQNQNKSFQINYSSSHTAVSATPWLSSIWYAAAVDSAINRWVVHILI